MGISLGLLAAGALWATPHSNAPKRIDFNRDIRPILAEKCFKCHGQDPKAVQAGLNLSDPQVATQPLKDRKVAIVPGQPDKSELISRINAKDPDDVMPPPDTHKTLSESDKATLRQWIAEGAEYKQHWAFVPPVRPPLPAVQHKTWPKNEIDRFILAKQEEEGLQPSPQADKATLIRRVSLDLTGLPPTPKELDDFLKDASPNAYEKVVDRLLASPRYGERMAMDWLDGARYADSNGYQADFERYQYRWRDWVINALNANMPFDEFTVEQIAGDMLPNATLDQKIASGFNRNHRINTEGGVIAEEWRVETVIDRVETTSTVWLGLTAGCARCHDHKYDPIKQRDFYGLFAYFNNVPESGTGEERPVNHPPLLKAPYPAQAEQLATLTSAVKALDGQVDTFLKRHEAEAQSWKPKEAAWPAPLTASMIGRWTFVPGTGTAYGKPTFAMGRSTGAVVTNMDSYLDLGNKGNFDKSDAFSYGAWIYPEDSVGSPFARMDTTKDYRGWDLFMDGGVVMVHLINKWPENALKVFTKMRIPLKKWTHVFVTYDGSAKPSGLKIYINGKPAELGTEKDALTGTIKTDVHLTVGRRTGDNSFKGQIDDLTLFSSVVKPEQIAQMANVSPAKPFATIPIEKRTPDQKQAITQEWGLESDPAFGRLIHQRDAASKNLESLDSQIPNLMVMEEMPKPRDAFVLIRGQYDKHGEKVGPAIPAFLPPMPKDAPNNRLGLARWIASPENPLTARVAVNRLWAMLFGTGIVATTEDFGTRADFPSHPELLDWLATEFVRLKWNLKAMLKEMVMSATYMQSSSITADRLEKDPQNRLLSHGPRFRLQAEVIRDQALAASGLLKEKIGGPSVRPYQPEGIWDETNFYGNLRNYKHDTDSGLYRRSLYTIWKRTAAPPNMTLFDAATRETCRVRRARTDTPLQALTLLNDVTYLEAARVLAQRALKEGGATPESRLAYAFRLVLCREPSEQEVQILEQGIQKRIAKYEADPKSAQELIKVGDAPIDPKIDPAELAAYTVAASTILNLDEAITKE